MVQIGTIEEDFSGTKKTLNKVRISWELPTETRVFKEENGEQPFILSKEFTLSSNVKATLRRWLESWMGKAFSEEETDRFDISILVGKPCMLKVIHNTKLDGCIRSSKEYQQMQAPKAVKIVHETTGELPF